MGGFRIVPPSSSLNPAPIYELDCIVLSSFFLKSQSPFGGSREASSSNMAKEEKNKKKRSFDDLLVVLGEFGPYQRRVYFFLFIPTIFSAMHKLAWVFLGAQADHRWVHWQICKMNPKAK